MSKLLNSTLEKVSESNNDYRKNLRKLNSQIDERTTALVGDIVTLSNYTIDFSNVLTASKEKLVNPILRIIESYVIKDLRSVENVNEQFIDKINDKIENTSVNTREEKEKFISNLDVLLNEKYLEIVNIKRVDFIGEDGNIDVENIINDFFNYLKSIGNYDETGLSSLLALYKKDIYSFILNTLSEISNLYQNNFVNEVSRDLSSIVDYDENGFEKENERDEFSKPYIPDINPVAHIDIPMSPEIPSFASVSDVQVQNDYVSPISLDDIKLKKTVVEEKKEMESMTKFENEANENRKKTYDVEEILKIAKSPVAAMEPVNEERKVTPIISTPKQPELEVEVEMEFNEHDLVEEMIRRFKKRLEAIDERQAKYDQDKKLVSDDEAFVNDLINSAETKKKELDAYEDELNKKQTELDEKEKDLETKINNVLPFANAVLENDKES